MVNLQLTATSLFITLSDDEVSSPIFQKCLEANTVRLFPEYLERPSYMKNRGFGNVDYLCEIDESCFYLLHKVNADYLTNSLGKFLEDLGRRKPEQRKYLAHHLKNDYFKLILFKYTFYSGYIYEIFKLNNKDLNLTLQDLDVLIENHIVSDHNGIFKDFGELLIRYKYESYSKEEIGAYSYRQTQLKDGLEYPTEYELKKDWVFTKDGNNINIIGYIGRANRVRIPKMLNDGRKIVSINDYIISDNFDEFLLVNVDEFHIHSIMHADNGIMVRDPGKALFICDEINSLKYSNVIEVHDPDYPRLTLTYEEAYVSSSSILAITWLSDDLYTFTVESSRGDMLEEMNNNIKMDWCPYIQGDYRHLLEFYDIDSLQDLGEIIGIDKNNDNEQYD